MSGHITERFDHDGMFRHHHASYTGDGYEEGEPIWWGHCEQFGGLKRDHRHTARAAAHPVDSSPFRQVVDELTGGCGCMCHMGTGYNTTCVHCRPVPPPDRVTGLRERRAATIHDLLVNGFGKCDHRDETMRMWQCRSWADDLAVIEAALHREDGA